jgi:hypothetical protein
MARRYASAVRLLIQYQGDLKAAAQATCRASGRRTSDWFVCRLSTVGSALICNQGVGGSNPSAGNPAHTVLPRFSTSACHASKSAIRHRTLSTPILQVRDCTARSIGRLPLSPHSGPGSLRANVHRIKDFNPAKKHGLPRKRGKEKSTGDAPGEEGKATDVRKLKNYKHDQASEEIFAQRYFGKSLQPSDRLHDWITAARRFGLS